MKIDLQIISSGYDRKTCWVHARPAVIPGNPFKAIVTAQKLRLSGDDVFREICEFRSDDGGMTWSDPISHVTTLGRKQHADGTEEAICDFTPMWHASSGRLLGTGLNALYKEDTQLPYPDCRSTAYSVYDEEARSWALWQPLAYASGTAHLIEGAGCTQRVDLPNGDILLPTYIREKRDPARLHETLHKSTVMRCRFDGEVLTYLEHGTELSLPGGRGLVEPSLVSFKGRYLLTLRNNERGYVAASGDGLVFDEPRPWTFDDGEDLGNYNTQQHWVDCGGKLYLVYTRKGANNDHIMRHRAPLFIAEVDPERLQIIRLTEQVLVPERGARLCNFGVAKISENETWVSVAEWMQTKLPNPFDGSICEAYGSDNSVFVAKIRSGVDGK